MDGAKFWFERQDLIVRALVHAGGFPDVRLDAYERELAAAEREGWPASHAAWIALARTRQEPSACAVNPW